jgi:hypothetical protein
MREKTMNEIRDRLGVLECFFGPPWPDSERLAYADFLGENGFGFYIYAPKADPFLRKRWREEWPEEFSARVSLLSRTYRARGLKFGVALSPFGLDTESPAKNREMLKEKVARLGDAGLDILGLFFDDMKVHEGLADKQLEALETVRSATSARIVFCPTFYTDDPILDKVFGQRPADYVSSIGRNAPADVELVWTGPKVISDEIPGSYLKEVSAILGRPPFLCDNLFANDGPRHSKFLKLKSLAGRDREAYENAGPWSVNPMNQSGVSKAVLLALRNRFLGQDETTAFESAVRVAYRPRTAEFVITNRKALLEEGLDGLDDTRKAAWIEKLDGFDDPVAREIADWLRGRYKVGEECLTD